MRKQRVIASRPACVSVSAPSAPTCASPGPTMPGIRRTRSSFALSCLKKLTSVHV